jgi:hypothetical protein
VDAVEEDPVLETGDGEAGTGAVVATGAAGDAAAADDGVIC